MGEKKKGPYTPAGIEMHDILGIFSPMQKLLVLDISEVGK